MNNISYDMPFSVVSYSSNNYGAKIEVPVYAGDGIEQAEVVKEEEQ